MTVQLSNQDESLTVTIPPVTTFPLKGSRFAIFLIYSGIRASKVVTVADSHFVFAISEQNTSGRPKHRSCLAIFFHKSHDSPFPFFIFDKSGALF